MEEFGDCQSLIPTCKTNHDRPSDVNISFDPLLNNQFLSSTPINLSESDSMNNNTSNNGDETLLSEHNNVRSLNDSWLIIQRTSKRCFTENKTLRQNRQLLEEQHQTELAKMKQEYEQRLNEINAGEIKQNYEHLSNEYSKIREQLKLEMKECQQKQRDFDNLRKMREQNLLMTKQIIDNQHSKDVSSIRQTIERCNQQLHSLTELEQRGKASLLKYEQRVRDELERKDNLLKIHRQLKNYIESIRIQLLGLDKKLESVEQEEDRRKNPNRNKSHSRSPPRKIRKVRSMKV
ncbi:unnamed protein product [Didymodactylos carnosus]|uniref:Uncharacterized protein n=1 Tax=Didymodactylos carnosus TaxID=1234261 RepID=A0A813SXZ2_9BILA|nr:unnamed protein product [Didymodactylos carnosus]CAF1239493.1 unnamed protein product [Didymodactylos carnosus]CAF3588743.1 unnamed protein product [Didymodactylos carnosus]CAF4046907.1 unnamed protein product [Didymodactylos carnosus]